MQRFFIKRLKCGLIYGSMMALTQLSLCAESLKYCENEKDKQVGCIERFYDDNGNLGAEATFKYGQLNGVMRTYREDGSIWGELTHKNGKKDGIVKVYSENGDLGCEIPYKNDKRDGIAKAFYPNGDLQAEIPYTDDKLNGTIKFYDFGKKLVWQVSARNGKLIGGQCLSGKALTNAHLTRLSKEITSDIVGGKYWHDMCKH